MAQDQAISLVLASGRRKSPRRTGQESCLLHTSKSLFGKDMLFVPEGRLRIAQDFSPGPAPGRKPWGVPEGRLRIAQDFSPGTPRPKPSGVPEGRLRFNRPSGTPEGFWPMAVPGLKSWAILNRPSGTKSISFPNRLLLVCKGQDRSPVLQSLRVSHFLLLALGERQEKMYP